MKEFLSDGDKTVLDLSGVTEVDTAGFQMLLVLLVEANKINRRVSFSSPSVAIDELFSILDVKSLVSQPVKSVS